MEYFKYQYGFPNIFIINSDRNFFKVSLVHNACQHPIDFYLQIEQVHIVMKL